MSFIIEKDGTRICFIFTNSLWICGYLREDGFHLYDRYYDDGKEALTKEKSRKGTGTKALQEVKVAYGPIYVHAVTESALPFWKKMKGRQVIQDIVSYWN
jgi:hypothetical protein